MTIVTYTFICISVSFTTTKGRPNPKRFLRLVWIKHNLIKMIHRKKWSLKLNLKYVGIHTSSRIRFKLWFGETTFCALIRFTCQVPSVLLHGHIQYLAVYNDTSFSIFECGSCWWWCFTCESTFQDLLERVMCHQSMMRTVCHYCRASHLLFRCGSVLYRDRAIGLPLSQKMTPSETFSW